MIIHKIKGEFSLFTKNELTKIMEYASETASAAIACGREMAQTSYRHRDGSAPTIGQIDEAFAEGRLAGEIYKKAARKLERIEFALPNARPAMIAVAISNN